MAPIMYPRVRKTIKIRRNNRRRWGKWKKKILFYSTDKRQYCREMWAWCWISNVDGVMSGREETWYINICGICWKNVWFWWWNYDMFGLLLNMARNERFNCISPSDIEYTTQTVTVRQPQPDGKNINGRCQNEAIFESLNVGAFTIGDWTVCHDVGPSEERFIWFMRNTCGWIGNCKPTEWYLNTNLIALYTHTHKHHAYCMWLKSNIFPHLNWCSRFNCPAYTTRYHCILHVL